VKTDARLKQLAWIPIGVNKHNSSSEAMDRIQQLVRILAEQRPVATPRSASSL